MESETDRLFDKVRQICLSFGEAFEKQSHGAPAFFVQKGGQFAALWDNHHNDGNTALLLAQPFGMQESLIAEDAAVFFRPAYFGPSGWVGIRIDKAQDWSLVADLIAQAYEFVAAKRRRAGKSASPAGVRP